MTTAATAVPVTALADDHSVLLWLTCAYAADVVETAEAGRDIAAGLASMLDFLHWGLLPYLRHEEQLLLEEDEQGSLASTVLAEHRRIRHDVAAIEQSKGHADRSRAAAGSLVMTLDQHIRREEGWVARRLATS